jgi:hypothetical protein
MCYKSENALRKQKLCHSSFYPMCVENVVWPKMKGENFCKVWMGWRAMEMRCEEKYVDVKTSINARAYLKMK